MYHVHSNRQFLCATAIVVLAGCSSSDRSNPPLTATLKQAARLASPPAPVAVSIPPLRAPDAGQPGDPSAAQAALNDPNVVAKLRHLALHFSSRAGVSSPTTMHAVAADHQAAEKIISGAVLPDHAPVYVIKMTGGPFTAPDKGRGGPAHQGKILTLTVDAATYRISDIGYINAEPDWSQIGPVAVNLGTP